MRESDRAALEQAGTVFGEKVVDNELFTDVTLPPGWKVIELDDGLHLDLRDEKERVRATIFYKSAVYDRNAHLYTKTRYTIEYELDDTWKEGRTVKRVIDQGMTVFTTNEHYYEDLGVDGEAAYNAATYEAAAWLDEHYPDWRDASAYWD